MKKQKFLVSTLIAIMTIGTMITFANTVAPIEREISTYQEQVGFSVEEKEVVINEMEESYMKLKDDSM